MLHGERNKNSGLEKLVTEIMGLGHPLRLGFWWDLLIMEVL